MGDEELRGLREFNVVVLGDAGVGKTAFIKAFGEWLESGAHSHERGRKALLPSSQSLHEVTFLLPHHSLRIQITDTPGYGHFESFLTWQSMVEAYITEQSVAFRDSSRDPRIHLCLYFLEGIRVRENDLKALYSLQSLVPVVPVLCKSETMTASEILAAKLNIAERCAFAGIHVLNCTQLDSTVLQRFNTAPLGPCPPFAVLSYIEEVGVGEGRTAWGRKYRWGVCEALNPQHCDFLLLCEALVEAFPSHCVAACAELTARVAALYESRVQALQQQSRAASSTSSLSQRLVDSLLWLFRY